MRGSLRSTGHAPQSTQLAGGSTQQISQCLTCCMHPHHDLESGGGRHARDCLWTSRRTGLLGNSYGGPHPRATPTAPPSSGPTAWVRVNNVAQNRDCKKIDMPARQATRIARRLAVLARLLLTLASTLRAHADGPQTCSRAPLRPAGAPDCPCGRRVACRVLRAPRSASVA